MSTSTNVILFDKLYEVQCLGDACLISIITTINLLLLTINDVIQKKSVKEVVLIIPTSNDKDEHCNHYGKSMVLYSSMPIGWIMLHSSPSTAFFDKAFRNTSSMREKSMMTVTDSISTLGIEGSLQRFI